MSLWYIELIYLFSLMRLSFSTLLIIIFWLVHFLPWLFSKIISFFTDMPKLPTQQGHNGLTLVQGPTSIKSSDSPSKMSCVVFIIISMPFWMMHYHESKLLFLENFCCSLKFSRWQFGKKNIHNHDEKIIHLIL